MTFEEAITKLDAIVKKMESGQISLEESVNAYETGIKLKEFCEKKLKEAELKITQLKPETLNSDGNIESKLFE